MKRYARLQSDVHPPFDESQTPFGAHRDPSFDTARNDTHNKVSISAWEPYLNKELGTTTPEVATTVQNKALFELKRGHVESCRTKAEDLISREVKSAVNEMDTKGLSTVVEWSLDDILRALFHDQSFIMSLSRCCWACYAST